MSNLSFLEEENIDRKADGDKTECLSSGIYWRATDSCDIPPTTFPQLIKLRTNPQRKT